MPVTDPIVIPVEGDPSDFIADAQKVQASMDALAARLKAAGVSQAAYNKAVSNSKAAMAGQVEAVKKTSMSMTDLRSSYMMVMDVVRVGQQVWAATGQEFINYAEQVKNLSRNIGVTAEDASRLIQVADDVRISYESLGIAMKIAQKQGIDVSISGLEKLADKYKSLAPGVERTQFLLKTFGKSGMEMGKLLEQGGDGVRKMSEAVEKGLIVTEKGIKASDDYQIAVDNLSDSWKAFTVTVGSAVVPALTKVVDGINLNIAAEGYLEEALKITNGDRVKAKHLAYEMAVADKVAADAIRDAANDTKDFAGAADESAAALAGQKEAVKYAEAALESYKNVLEEASQANQDAESFMQSYADSQKDYVDQHADAVKAVTEAEEKLNDAMSKKAKTKDQKEARLEGIEEAKTGLLEAGAAVQELEATWHENTQKMIYDMIMAKVSVDGLTDAEFKATQQLAVQMGIRTQAEADTANAMMDTASAAAEGIAMQEDVMNEKAQSDAVLLSLEEQKRNAADDTTAAIVDGSGQSAQAIDQVVLETNQAILAQQRLRDAALNTAAAYKSIPAGGGTGTPKAKAAPAPKSKPRTGRNYGTSMDSGGVGIAGTPYSIGVPEVFVPNTGGEFVPLGGVNSKGLGTTYNINITNAKPESAEYSIRKALQSLSYLGVAA